MSGIERRGILSELLTFDTWDHFQLPEFDEKSETKGALEVLEWAYDHYGEKIVYSCSFGIEGSVLVDLIYKINPKATVVFLDTGLHFQETYETIDKARERYPELNIVMQRPELTLQRQSEQYGEELWKKDPNLCCHLRKIVPLKSVLEPVEAWISGLRREQSETRKHTNYINLDKKFGKIKICPLIHWTWKEIWRYAYNEELPYHPLHDQGYPSIGCQPCTSPVFDLEDLRAGRWKGTGKTECGLHLPS